MIYKKGLAVLVSMAIFCGFEGLSLSEDFCVGTSQELQDALTTAAGNDESDLIKIAQGTYIGNFRFSSFNGDAVSILGGYATDCSTRIVNPVNTVLDGNSDGLVLQVTNTAGGNIDIEGLKIQHGEVASSGAGILARSLGSDIGGHITFTNNWVTENTDISSNSGGGIYIWSEGNTTGGNITLTSNKVTQNKGGFGGGIYARSCSYSGQGGNVSLIKNIIINNSATHMSGGVDAQSYATEGFSGDITFIGNLIAGNKATNHAGGVFVDSFSNNGTAGDTFFVNNTIVENRTNGIGGGLLLNRRADNYFYNNLFWGNFPSQDVLQGPAGTVNGFNNNGMQFNNWTSAANNMNVDPFFYTNGSWDDGGTPADISDDVWLEGDNHIRADSPCIDSGNSDAPDMPVDDFEMDPRVADGDHNGTATVDIGADEFYNLCPMDIDGDGDVDGSDLSTCSADSGEGTLADLASDFGGQGCRIPFYSPRLYNLRLSQTTLPVPPEGERYTILMSFEYEDHDADIQELFLTRINPGEAPVLRTKAFTPTGTGGIFMGQLTIDSTYAAGTYTISAEIVDARGIKSEIRTVTFALDEATAPPLAISGMSPLSGKPGDTITIQGIGFVADPPSDNHVYFGGTQAEVVAAASDALEVVVPEGAQSGPVVVETEAGQVTSANPFTVDTTITISPVITRMVTGEDVVFLYTVSGGMPSGLLWLAYADEPCNGSECGTISATDTHCTYTAPDAVPVSNPIYIRCSSADDGLIYGEIAIEILDPPPPPGEGVISPTEGGEVNDANHTVQISVPADVLAFEETIAIEELNPESIPLPSTDSVNLAAARFSPPGLMFSATTPAEVTFTLTSWQEPGTVLDLWFYDDILDFFQNVGTVVVGENGLAATGQLEQFEEAGYDPGSTIPEDGMEYGSPTYVVNRPLELTTSRAQVLQNFNDKLRDFSSLWIIRKPIDLTFYEGQSIPVIIKPLLGQGIGPGPLHPMIPVTVATQNETIPIGAKQVKPDGWQLGTVLHIPVIPDCNEGETRHATVSIGGAGTDEEITVGFDIQCLCELNFDGNTPPGTVPEGVDTSFWDSQHTVYFDSLGQTYRFSEINLGADAILSPAYTNPSEGAVIDPLIVEVTGDVRIAGEMDLRGAAGGLGKDGDEDSSGGAGYHINAGMGGHGGLVENYMVNTPIPFICMHPPCYLDISFGLTGQNALGPAGLWGAGGAGGAVWDAGCAFDIVPNLLKLVVDLGTLNWVGAVQDAYGIVDNSIRIYYSNDNYTASAGRGGGGGGYIKYPGDLVFFYPPAAGGGGGGSGMKDTDTLSACTDKDGAGGGGGGGGGCNLKLVAGGSVIVEPGGVINGSGGRGGRGGNGEGSGDGQAAPGGGGGGGGGSAIHIVAVKGLINYGEIKALGGIGGLSGEISGDFGGGVEAILFRKSFGGLGRNGILRVDGSFSGNSPVGMYFYKGPVFGDANRFTISADATLPVHQFLGDEGRIDLGDGNYTGNEFIQNYPLSDGFNTLAVSIDSPYTPEVNEMELHPWQKLYALYFAGMPDSDGDGLADGMEDYIGTRSDLPDTDGDGLVDGKEVNLYGTDPLITDTDSDGLTDGQEINVYDTNPLKRDTDGDGYSDMLEVNAGTDPKDPEDYPLDDYINSLGMAFNLIPSGTFTMGSPESELGRRPDEIQHMVTLTQSFYMQTTEVTQAQWEVVMGSNPSYFSGCSDCPVESVTWYDVQDFITAMNALGEGTYRLPTEAEWEYAARAGSTTAFANGDITEVGCGYDPNLNAMGWYCYNASSQTHPVAQKQANAWGLYDMHGNVWEWCQDWYGSYPTGPVTDPTGPTEGSYRVRRGGSWYDNAWYCRSPLRWNSPPFGKSFDRGLRLSWTNCQAVIPVGNGPRGIRITPDGDYAYAANNSDNSVSVIDTSSNTVVDTISVGNFPWKIEITPNGSYAYVTNSYDDTVSVINTSSNSVVNTISVGDGPSKIAITPNGNYAYVTNWYGDTVSVINTSTNTVVDTVSVGDTPYGIDITPNGDYVYVTNYNHYTVSVINTSTNSVVDTISVGNAPAGVAITPDGNYAYVTNLNDNTVSVIDTSTNGVVDTLLVGTAPAGVEITPNGNYMYVLNWYGNTVSVIDTLSNSVVDTIPVGTYPWDISITPDGNFGYITNNGDNTVSMIYLRPY